jgi:hypothetical protein
MVTIIAMWLIVKAIPWLWILGVGLGTGFGHVLAIILVAALVIKGIAVLFSL